MQELFEKYKQRARQERERGHLEEAARAVDSALFLEPLDDDALILCVRILQDKGDLESALERLEERLAQSPYHVWAILEIAEILINSLQRSEDGLLWLARFFRLRGMKPRQEIQACRLRAEALLDQGRYEEAWSFLQRALKRYKEEQSLSFLAGWTALRIGKPQEACRSFCSVLVQEPEHADAHYYLGVAYEYLANPEACRAAFLQTYALDRETPPHLRLSLPEFRKAVLSIAKTEIVGFEHTLLVRVSSYPDNRLLSLSPGDPRRMALSFTPRLSLHLEEAAPVTILYLFHWNIERFCSSSDEIQREIRFILQEEVAALRLWTPSTDTLEATAS
jgi:tetratricopeptide (TPR) repeat protein